MKKIADNHAVLNHVECNIMRGFAILAVASNNLSILLTVKKMFDGNIYILNHSFWLF